MAICTISVFMVPVYKSYTKPVCKIIRVWPDGAVSALQDCFASTDRDNFREAATYGDSTNLEYTESVTGYKCIADFTVSKDVTTRDN